MFVLKGKEPRISTEVVTPELASQILERNTSNRNIRQHRVMQMASDMANGRWVENGETIKIATDGTLIDGQHRLWAVVESGKSIPLVIIENLPKEAQATIDIGSQRTVADVVGMRGVSNANLLSAIATLVLKYQQIPDNVWSGPAAAITKPMVVEFIEQNLPLLQQATAMAMDLGHIRLRNSAYGAAVFVIASQGSSEYLEDFHRGVQTGAELGMKDPRLVLRNYALNRNQQHTGWVSQQTMAVVLKAFNAYVRGKEVSLFRFTRDELPMPKVA